MKSVDGNKLASKKVPAKGQAGGAEHKGSKPSNTPSSGGKKGVGVGKGVKKK